MKLEVPFFGAVALMQALKEMNKIGFELIESNEKKLLKILIEGMKILKE